MESPKQFEQPGDQINPVPPVVPTTPIYQPVRKKNNPALPIVLALGLLLVAIAGWLTYNTIQATGELELKVADLQESEHLRTELEAQYNQAIAELESMKGDNIQLNALIEEQKTDLELKKKEISSLLKDRKKLNAARAEINNLKAKIGGYLAQIEQLKAEQEQLVQSNSSLKTAADSLNMAILQRAQENESLNTAKATLVSEREDLSKKVEIGSVVKVKDIQVTGQKVRKSGKTSEKSSAKRVDQLKICFTTLSNDVVQGGNEKFFVRILNPKGETLAIDDLGSGGVQNRKSGEDVRYTQVQEYEYANDETPLCFTWSPNMPFQSGKYNVEVYNKGYLSGTGIFELK